jgi:hypothetical protein
MIIDFKGNSGGGGGGTTNYNQLENKPQINGVTLSGNVSSDQLDITPNELKAVENVPSAATNGSIFAVASGSNISLKQAYSQEIEVSRWDKYSHYEGRYQLYQFKPLEGFSFPSEKTFIGQVYYYDIVIKAYTNSGLTYAVDCSTDSGETWAEYVIPCDGQEYQYSLTGSSTAKVMNAKFKAEFYPYDPSDHGYFNIESDKFMWEDNLVVLTKNILNYYNFPKTHWVPFTDFQTYAMEGKCNYVRGNCVSDGEYYCNVGQIDGNTVAFYVTVSGGVITNTGGYLYCNAIDGHYYMTGKLSDETTYGAHCWMDGGKLYWQSFGGTIVHIDNNELGADWEAGFIY